MKYLLLLFLFQTPDTVKVTVKDLDTEITRRTTELQQLLQNIEQAKQNAIYLEGGLNALKEQRQKFNEIKKDTVKTKNKKEK